jgi:hypothetical protein
MSDYQKAETLEVAAARRAWEAPKLQRMSAEAAELTVGDMDDGVDES